MKASILLTLVYAVLALQEIHLLAGGTPVKEGFLRGFLLGFGLKVLGFGGLEVSRPLSKHTLRCACLASSTAFIAICMLMYLELYGLIGWSAVSGLEGLKAFIENTL